MSERAPPAIRRVPANRAVSPDRSPRHWAVVSSWCVPTRRPGRHRLDESGTAKSGNHTTGVKRQCNGNRGKIENYVPDEITFQTKPQIALSLIDRALRNGIAVMAWTADELYGRDGAFLDGLDQPKEAFVVEIPPNFHVWLAKPKVLNKPPRNARGRPPWTVSDSHDDAATSHITLRPNAKPTTPAETPRHPSPIERRSAGNSRILESTPTESNPYRPKPRHVKLTPSNLPLSS